MEPVSSPVQRVRRVHQTTFELESDFSALLLPTLKLRVFHRNSLHNNMDFRSSNIQ